VLKVTKGNESQIYLEFGIEANDGIYQIRERSLGFRWFFTFLLFTQFRPFRKESPQNVIFLFDEPASNLHPSAQQQLLKSFENLTNSKIIYTTHSHHLINPNWLESTYVVRNDGLNLDDPEIFNVKKTSITIESYREFAIKHPKNTAYFQPILDVLDYIPNQLENIPDCIFLEGKNDYYILSYFNSVIFNNRYKINLSPAFGSGNLGTLISLYTGWGKDFLVFLDADEEGLKQRERYISSFGTIVNNRIFSLSDVDNDWKMKEMEDMLDNDDLLNFQRTTYPDTSQFNKTHFNRTIQEKLINKQKFSFKKETTDKFDTIFNFLSAKLLALKA
jgi:hypothetical protein